MSRQTKARVIFDDKGVYVLDASLPVYVKTAAVCAMTGKSNQWIGQLTSQGTLNKTRTPHGTLYALEPNMLAYCRMMEERSLSTDDELERDRLLSENSIKKAKAVVAALEAKELQGKMHRSEDVAAIVGELVATVRAQLMGLPGRLAVEVAEKKTAAEAAVVIRDGLYDLLSGLSRFEYDPARYEERVRERRRWETQQEDEEDEDHSAQV